MVRGNCRLALSASVDILAEVQRLAWPIKWIGHTLRAIPGRHRSPYLDVIRKLGKFIEKQQCDVSTDTLEREYYFLALEVQYTELDFR